MGKGQCILLEIDYESKKWPQSSQVTPVRRISRNTHIPHSGQKKKQKKTKKKTPKCPKSVFLLIKHPGRTQNCLLRAKKLTNLKHFLSTTYPHSTYPTFIFLVVKMAKNCDFRHLKNGAHQKLLSVIKQWRQRVRA